MNFIVDGAGTANSTLYKDYRGLYNKTVDGANQELMIQKRMRPFRMTHINGHCLN